MLNVSIHTLHELEARRVQIEPLHAARESFHSYASRIGSKVPYSDPKCPHYPVSIHTLHELEASRSVWVFLKRKPNRFHSYASRIGSKLDRNSARHMTKIKVSIHTLHELEARIRIKNPALLHVSFPFIRFTNWKQAGLTVPTPLSDWTFPFIRFTNWKQA